MRTATGLEWVKIGVQSWVVFGAILGVLAAFEPALTFLSLGQTWPTIILVIFFSAIAGCIHGFLAFMRFSGDFSMELPVTRMVIIVWGIILGAALFGLFFLMPIVEGASLRPVLTRCLIGCAAGLLAGGLMVGRVHPA